MARKQTSTARTVRASAPDICPECESDTEAERTPNGFQVACTSCRMAGPVEPTRAAAVRFWAKLAAKVRGFDRVREIVGNSARVSA